MSEKPSAYYKPNSLTEAVQLLTQPDTVPLSGGTKLLAEATSSAVVDLQALGLNQLEWKGEELQIGATVTLTSLVESLAENEANNSPAKLLQKAIRLAGPNTFRNAATFGGMIASRTADSEFLAALLVLEAVVTVHNPDVMSIKLVDYIGAAQRPQGIITNIILPWKQGKGDSQRVARTPADSPIVSVTLWKPDNESPRLVATGISMTPVRLTAAENELKKEITDTTIGAAAASVKNVTIHPGDFRGDTSYRAEMAAILTRRICEDTL